jgi:Bacterial Ig domain
MFNNNIPTMSSVKHMLNGNKSLLLLAVAIFAAAGQLQAQIAAFNFSGSSNTVSGWTNVVGDPALGVQTATAGGITISTVSTANWSPNGSGNCALNGWGYSSGTYFPSQVMTDEWIQYNGSGNNLALYNESVPQLRLSSLNPDSTYTLRMTGSNGSYNNPTVYSVVGATAAGSQSLNTYQNRSQGITFVQVAPNSSGIISIYVNCPSGLSGTNFAWICGVEVFSGSSNVGVPQVSISLPTNGTVVSEGANVIINAAATETGGTISKVEFYEDTSKIGEVDAPPYNFTWVGPDPGPYTITAKATDNAGTINSATVNIGVQSLNYYWSTTGNVGNNGDSNFVGNVDSVRLGLRTKNIERLTISPIGYVGIGTITPTAQLHITGTVRMAGLTNDSTKTRVLVSDTSGNLFYRNASSISGPWQYSNGTVYDSLDNIAVGTSNPQGYKLAVNGTAIFTKVKVKTAGTWPDYVFGNGYTPPDLRSLETYLRTYHHLPGIISEADVQRDGIDVGDQQAAILKKVEELTLYLIEQNKNLTEQNHQLQDQNNKLQDLQRQIDELKKLLSEKK